MATMAKEVTPLCQGARPLSNDDDDNDDDNYDDLSTMMATI